MSRIRADKLVNRVGSGGPKFPNGVADGFSVTGIVTATSFSGPLTGAVTGNVTGNADTATSATTATTAGALGSGATGSDLTLSGNLTVNGTTTTIDTAVTAVDSLAVDGNITSGGDVSIADKIIHTGDTNTSLRFPANDTVTVETAGTERVRVTSDGKVGINQSTPQTTFHSTGTTNGQQATFGIDNSGLKISTFQKTDNDAGVILDAQQSSNGTLTFATSGTERLRIDSAGEIATGTIPLTHSSARYIYISDSGDDTTGNGTSSAPWRTMSKALGQVPKFLVHNCQIIIMGSSFTDGAGNNTLKGICGPGKVYISSQSGVVTYNKTKQFVVYDCQAWIEFQNIAFVCPVGSTGFALERNHYIDFKSGCTYEFQGQGGWSWQAGVYALHNDRMIVACNTTCTSSSTSGLGGVWLFDNCKRVSFNGDLTKNGTQFNNHGIAATNGTWIYLSGDVTNFVRGFALGANHYGNETRADAVVQTSTFTDCGTGIYLYNGSLLRNYTSSFSNTTTNINSTNGFVY